MHDAMARVRQLSTSDKSDVARSPAPVQLQSSSLTSLNPAAQLKSASLSTVPSLRSPISVYS